MTIKHSGLISQLALPTRDREREPTLANKDVRLRGTIQFLRDTVVNYPTLAEAYRVAALNDRNKV